MSCYVDELKTFETQSIKPGARHCGRQWCHLHSDSEEELHQFAARLGLKRAWFQDHRNPLFRHYDLVPSKRALAVKLGAKEITTQEWVRQYLKWNGRGNDRGGDPEEAGADLRPDRGGAEQH